MWPASAHWLQFRLAAAQPRKPAGAFAFNQRSQSFVDQHCSFLHASNALGFVEEVVVDVDSSAHDSDLLCHALSRHQMMPQFMH